ncbi:ABC transporter substrate-binding protein [Pseudonocardia endophytica]|uniref:NitT/TauT family transport system substrate-binding protein n=1 Tax=Pseudonocardia endophytica TaxID=401976 RepID=A0A4R1HJ15_PSEEN|nr:ABC transporter substrate-binding protein [Pseudonocardia endophytica]TCK21828.1 NitT/TauT family transport system substrate-binding protein [Pseudonocardia endophytica]
MKAITAAAAVLTAVLALAGCGTPAGTTAGRTGPAGTITVGYSQQGAAYSDLYTCVDEGVFDRNGIHVELTQLNSSSQMLAAVSSGSVQIAVGLAEAMASGALKGLDVRYIAVPIDRYYLEMWGATDIGSPADLAGKRVAVSSPGSQSDIALRTMLADEGLTGRVTVQYLKTVSAEITALEQGAVDAIVSQPPNATRTGERGFHKILDFTGYPAAANAYSVTGDFLDTNRDEVAAFVRSQVECTSLLKQREAESVASIRRHSGTDDQELATYAWDFFRRLMREKPYVDEELLRASFESAADKQDTTAPQDVSKYVDNSFLDELDRSGFIDSLYGR